MADEQEKTEDPTGKRLEDARKKGQLARSKELSTALVLVAKNSFQPIQGTEQRYTTCKFPRLLD